MRRALATVGALIALGGVAVGCGGGDDDAASGGNGKGGGEASSAEFCDQVRDLEQKFSEATSDDKDLANQAIEDVKGLDFPAEIKDDFDKMIGVMEQFRDLDTSDPEAMSKVAALANDDDLKKASDNITKFMKDECGIDAGDSSDSGGSGDGADSGDAGSGNG